MMFPDFPALQTGPVNQNIHRACLRDALICRFCRTVPRASGDLKYRRSFCPYPLCRQAGPIYRHIRSRVTKVTWVSLRVRRTWAMRMWYFINCPSSIWTVICGSLQTGKVTFSRRLNALLRCLSIIMKTCTNRAKGFHQANLQSSIAAS